MDVGVGKHVLARQMGSRLVGREALAAHGGSGGAAARPGHLHHALATAVRQRHHFRETGPVGSPLAAIGYTGPLVLSDGLADRRRLFGRLAAMFFAGAGVLGLVTLPLPAPGSDKTVTAVVYAVALALGIAIGWRRGTDGRGGPAWRSCRRRSP
jgi:hypothetical protein